MASENSSTRRSLTRLVLLSLLLTMMPARAFAWSKPGHNVVARIADRMLEENARQGIRNFLNLNTDELWKISTWADDVRYVDFDENFQMKPQFRPETFQWHFVDIPLFKFGTYNFETEYNEARDCQPKRDGDCAIRAIVQFEKILAESAANPKSNTNADLMAQLKSAERGSREYFNILNQFQSRLRGGDAIKFLVHFIGDIHQPLHTISNCYDAQCTRSDAGGNSVKVRLKWPGYMWDKNSQTPTDKMTNLHSTWDGDFVERDMQQLIKNKKINPKDTSREAREEAYAEWLMKNIQPPAAEANLMDVIGWTRKTHQQAVQAYGPVVSKLKATKKQQLDDKEVIDLDDKYFNDNIENGVRRQLVLAGVRLAKVLNATLVKPQSPASQ